MPMMMMLNREVRRVPMDYEPPQHERGGYRSCFDEFYEVALEEYLKARDAWASGEDPDRAKYPDMTYEEWNGGAPDHESYYPGRAWPEDAVMGIRMYETTSEGTPISRAYPDTAEGRKAMAEELAGTSHGFTAGMSADQWMEVIEGQVLVKDIHTGELS